MKEKLLGMTLEELQKAAVSVGLKPFVGRQLADWMYGKRVVSWDAMTNIAKASKTALSERFDLGFLPPLGSVESSDGTRKYLFPAAAGSAWAIEGPFPLFSGPAMAAGSPAAARASAPEAGRQLPSEGKNEGGMPSFGHNLPASGMIYGAAADADSAADSPDNAVEAVMIPEGERRTLCVSSQAGCKMGCKFCMTGRQGFHGNLDAAAILSQFVGVDESTELTNAVFMGMGEPLDNYDAVMRVIEVLTSDWGFGWSPKRITLSTIGVLPALKRYLDGSRCHLAVSLHNPFPEERYHMMPVQKAYDIREVVELLRKYDFSGQRRVSFEYTMFGGWNDDTRHADALVRLLGRIECRVNLIRFHKIPDFPYDCASDAAMETFKDRLNNNGIVCTIRTSRGEDILAACGMLAGKHSSSRR